MIAHVVIERQMGLRGREAERHRDREAERQRGRETETQRRKDAESQARLGIGERLCFSLTGAANVSRTEQFQSAWWRQATGGQCASRM